MEKLTWTSPLKGRLSNFQKALALIVLLPAVPFLALVSTWLVPTLKLQDILLTVDPVILALLAATSVVVLVNAICLPDAYKTSSMYIGSGIGTLLMIIDRVNVPVLGYLTWLLVAVCAGLLSYIRTNADIDVDL